MVTLNTVICYAWSVLFFYAHLSILYSQDILSPPAKVPHLLSCSILIQQDRYCRVMKTLWLVKILWYKESWSFIKYMSHRNVLQMKVVHLNEICVSFHVPDFAGIHYFTLWRTMCCVMQHWVVWHKVTTVLEAPPKHGFWLPDYMASHPIWL
jgi:hypothetical protein